MLDPFEANQLRQKFGVPIEQIMRDHAISHVLSVIKRVKTPFTFYGGTALARTYLPFGRLSEDIDIFSTRREELIREFESLSGWLEQEFPNAEWVVNPAKLEDGESALLRCGPGIHVRIQLVDSTIRNWGAVPLETAKIEQRFSDVPATELRVPTLNGFVAMKALSWFDRGAPRDLFDMGGLAKFGHVTEIARATIEQILGFRLTTSMIHRSAAGDWQTELAHQTQDYGNEAECLTRVLEWWGSGG